MQKYQKDTHRYTETSKITTTIVDKDWLKRYKTTATKINNSTKKHDKNAKEV